MLGFQSFRCDQVLISGIELMHSIHKNADAQPSRYHYVCCTAILFFGLLTQLHPNGFDYSNLLTATEPKNSQLTIVKPKMLKAWTTSRPEQPNIGNAP